MEGSSEETGEEAAAAEKAATLAWYVEQAKLATRLGVSYDSRQLVMKLLMTPLP